MIEIEKNKIKIKLNKKFYDLNAVKESLKAFNKVCSGDIKKNKEIIKITLKPKDKSQTNILGHEFCNYVLGLMKNKIIV